MVSELSKSISALRKAYTEGKAKVTITKKDTGETKEYIRTSGGSSRKANVQETQESKINRAVQQYAKTGVADTTGLTREEAQTVIKKAIPLRNQQLSRQEQKEPVIESPSSIQTKEQQKERLSKYNVPLREEYTTPPPPPQISQQNINKVEKPYLQTYEAPKILGVRVPDSLRQFGSDFAAGYENPRENQQLGSTSLGNAAKAIQTISMFNAAGNVANTFNTFARNLGTGGKVLYSFARAGIGAEAGKEAGNYINNIYTPTINKQLINLPESQKKYKEFRDVVAGNVDYDKQYNQDFEAFNKAKSIQEGKFYSEALNLGLPAEEAQKQFNTQFNSQSEQALFNEFKNRGYSDVKAQEFTEGILKGEKREVDNSTLGKIKNFTTKSVLNIGGSLPYLEQITPNYKNSRTEFANRLKDLGYTDKQIKEELKLIQSKQDVESKRELGGLIGAEIFGGELTGRLLNVGGTTKLKAAVGLSYAGALEGLSGYFVQTDTRKQKATLGGAAFAAGTGAVVAPVLGVPAIYGKGIKKVAARGIGYAVDFPLEIIGDVTTEAGTKVLGRSAGKGAAVLTPSFAFSPAQTEQFNLNLVQSLSPTTTPNLNPTYSFTPAINPSFNPVEVPEVSFNINPSFNPSFNPVEVPSNVPADVPTYDFTPVEIPTNTPTNVPTNVNSFSPSFVPTPLWRLPAPVLPDLSGFGSSAARGGSKKNVSFVNELSFGLNVLKKGLGFGFGMPQTTKEAQKVFNDKKQSLNIFGFNKKNKSSYDYNNLIFGSKKKTKSKKKNLNKRKNKSKKSKKKKK